MLVVMFEPPQDYSLLPNAEDAFHSYIDGCEYHLVARWDGSQTWVGIGKRTVDGLETLIMPAEVAEFIGRLLSH
jgi:hypothetical protein